MKGPRELKRYVAMMRKHANRRNGAIPGHYWDDLKVFKLERCKKWRSRPRHRAAPASDE